MRFSAIVSALLLAVSVRAADHAVAVGQGGLNFVPNELKGVAGGDTITFTFNGAHTATQSTFGSPCTPMSGGADSGIKATGTFVFDVPASLSGPLWFYCAQPGHCQAGMVFAVNAPANATFTDFQNKAEGKASAATSSAGSSVSGTATKASSPTSSSSSSGNGGYGSSGGAAKMGGNAPFLVVFTGLILGLAL